MRFVMIAKFTRKFIQNLLSSIKFMFEYWDKFTISSILISFLFMLFFIYVFIYYLYKIPLQQVIFVSLQYVPPLIAEVFGVFLLYNVLVYPALKIIYSSQFDVRAYVQLDKYLHGKLYLKEFLRLFYPQRKYVGFIVLIIFIILIYVLFTLFTANNLYTSMMVILTCGSIIFPGTLIGLARAYRFMDVIVSFAEKGCKNSSELPQHVKQAIITLGLCELCDGVSKYFIDHKVTLGSIVLIVMLISISGAKSIRNLIRPDQSITMATPDSLSVFVPILFLYIIPFVMTTVYYIFTLSTLALVRKSRRLDGTSTLVKSLLKEVYYDIAIPIVVLILKIILEGEQLNFITLLFDILMTLSLATVAYYFKVFVPQQTCKKG